MQEEFDSGPVTIVNNGNTATEAKVTVTGIPTTPPAASNDRLRHQPRTTTCLDGTEADLTDVTQNDRFVVVLTDDAGAAGLGPVCGCRSAARGLRDREPRPVAGRQRRRLSSWLSANTPSHVESRTDQYVAAFRYTLGRGELRDRLHGPRHVSRATFVLPGATVEDMYRPEFRGNTDAGEIEVKTAGP